MDDLSNKEKRVLESHREILWLKRQIKQLQYEENAEEISIPESATLENVLDSLNIYKDHINKMKVELDNHVQQNTTKNEAIRVVDEHNQVMEALYPEPTDHQARQLKQRTEDCIHRRDRLVSQFLRLVEEYNTHNVELTQIQREVIQRHRTNRQIMNDIITITNRAGEDSTPVQELQRL